MSPMEFKPYRNFCSEEINSARDQGLPIVALESTLISHGLPYPTNLETALAAEAAVRAAGAIPATIGVLQGEPVIGLNPKQIEFFANSKEIRKASSRDLAWLRVKKLDAATTVAASCRIAEEAHIQFFATGGIGGVHRSPAPRFDISNDLFELTRIRTTVVCSGAKNILDLPNTLELLETFGIAVIGYRTEEFPAFYVSSSGLPVPFRLDTPREIAELSAFTQDSILVTNPISRDLSIEPDDFLTWLNRAERDAERLNIAGSAVTPFLLKRIAELSEGRTLKANRGLIVENARLAAEIAVEHGKLQGDDRENPPK